MGILTMPKSIMKEGAYSTVETLSGKEHDSHVIIHSITSLVYIVQCVRTDKGFARESLNALSSRAIHVDFLQPTLR